MGGRTVKYLLPLMLLTGCASTVVKEVPVTVKVPVTAPCVKNKPVEVTALREQYTKERWASLTTDQRQALIVSQGLDRKAFGDKAMIVVAGCPE